MRGGSGLCVGPEMFVVHFGGGVGEVYRAIAEGFGRGVRLGHMGRYLYPSIERAWRLWRSSSQGGDGSVESRVGNLLYKSMGMPSCFARWHLTQQGSDV